MPLAPGVQDVYEKDLAQIAEAVGYRLLVYWEGEEANFELALETIKAVAVLELFSCSESVLGVAVAESDLAAVVPPAAADLAGATVQSRAHV